MAYSKIRLYLIFLIKYDMIKGSKVLILLLLFSGTIGFSQQLSHQVLVPAAGLITGGSINYSQTIGETATDLMSSSGFALTQGFQQPSIKISAQTPSSGTGVDVYPNPATDFIRIKMFGSTARNFKIEIINLTGTIISSTSMNFITSYDYIEQIDVTMLKLGFYFVRVTSDDLTINRIFKIEKM
jgi:Secretion system C-terminal sorting domain